MRSSVKWKTKYQAFSLSGVAKNITKNKDLRICFRILSNKNTKLLLNILEINILKVFKTKVNNIRTILLTLNWYKPKFNVVLN